MLKMSDDNPACMDVPLDKLRQLVIAFYDARDTKADVNRFLHVPSQDGAQSYFVKFGPRSDILAEAHTQAYIHSLAETASDPTAPRVPEVIDTFEHGHIAFAVMQHVPAPATTLDVWISGSSTKEEKARRTELAVSKVVAAVDWLHSCSLPPSAKLGSVGGGPGRHRFFPDHKVPIDFASTEALERYVNKALRLLPPMMGTYSTSLKGSPLQFCHSDIRWQNFMICPDTLEFWMIDYEHISIMPSAFASFAIHCNPHDLPSAISERISLQPWHDLENLVRACHRIVSVARKDLCLDANGYPIPGITSKKWDRMESLHRAREEAQRAAQSGGSQVVSAV